jgi:hypothetical protein
MLLNKRERKKKLKKKIRVKLNKITLFMVLNLKIFNNKIKIEFNLISLNILKKYIHLIYIYYY